MGCVNEMIAFLIALLSCQFDHGLSQNCIWQWTQPVATNYSRSVSAPAQFSATVTDVPLSGIRVTWRFHKSDFIVHEYTSANGNYKVITNNARASVSTARIGSSGQYSLNVSSLLVNDNGAAMSIVSEGCSVATASSPEITLDVKFCNSSFFEPVATANSTSDCGYNCSQLFTCTNSSSNFTALCQADATWDKTAAQCPCSNDALLPSAIAADNTQVVVGQTKVFQCACTTEVTQFTAACGLGGVWDFNVNNTPCNVTACNASEVAFGTPATNSSIICGNQSFTCLSSLVCSAKKFTLQCNADGTWASLKNPCIKETCDQSTIDTACGGYCQHGNISELTCNEPLNYTCAAGAIATTADPVYCVATNTLNLSRPLCKYMSTEATTQLLTTDATAPCQENCNSIAIRNICGDLCTYGNLSQVMCNEQLNYSCIGSSTPVPTSPVYCIGKNSFNWSTPLCKAKDQCKDCGSHGSDTGSGDVNIGAIIAGAFGGLVFVLILFVVITYCLDKCRMRKHVGNLASCMDCGKGKPKEHATNVGKEPAERQPLDSMASKPSGDRSTHETSSLVEESENGSES